MGPTWRRLLSKGYEVFGIVRGSPTASYPNLQSVRDDVRLHQGDLLDQMTLLDAITRAEPDELYNLAATSFVPVSWRQPVMTAQFTAVSVTSMLEAVRITNPGLRVYQASTSEIFGSTTESPTERTPFAPRNPDELRLGNFDATRDWSFARVVAEAMSLMLQQESGDDFVVCSGSAAPWASRGLGCSRWLCWS